MLHKPSTWQMAIHGKG